MHRLTSLFFVGSHLAGEVNAHRSTRLPHSRLRLSMVVSGCNFFFFTLRIKNLKPHWATLWFILHQTISQSSISISRSNHLVSTTAHNLPANCFCFILIWIFAVPSSFIFSTSEHHRTHIQYLLTVESFRTERTLELCGNKYCWNITHQNSERITPPPAVNYTHARFITLHNLQHPYLPCTVNLLLFINILKKVQRYILHLVIPQVSIVELTGDCQRRRRLNVTQRGGLQFDFTFSFKILFDCVLYFQFKCYRCFICKHIGNIGDSSEGEYISNRPGRASTRVRSQPREKMRFVFLWLMSFDSMICVCVVLCWAVCWVRP